MSRETSVSSRPRGVSRRRPGESFREAAGVIGVLGATGGVGASCLVVALASQAAMAGSRVVAVDGHPASGCLDVLVDREAAQGVRWADLAQARGRIDGAALLPLLPTSPEGVSVLSGSAGETAPDEVVRSTVASLREAADLVVVDLPRLGAPSLPGLLLGCRDVLLVVGCAVPALARAAGVAGELERLAPSATRLWLVQRCPRGGADLAERVAAELGIALAGTVSDDPRLDDHLARGVVPGVPRGRLATDVRHLRRLLSRQEPS